MAQSLAAGFDRLIAALRDPRCYPHPVDRVEVLQTHISAVLLTGSLAYKIKKPVNLGFLDFSSLAARRFYCEEELRLNRRTAPELYLRVVPITGSEDAPAIGGSGSPIEYALVMRQFQQQALFDAMARRGALSRTHMADLAHAVAKFHAAAARAEPLGSFGSPEKVLSLALENFDQIRALAAEGSTRLEQLRAWTCEEHARRVAMFTARAQEGFVRECHGDLHLRNIALIDGVPTPFDCIEFSDELRWIDVMSELAFLVMDLFAHRLPGLAFAFLDAYLEHAGDYQGLALLRFYAVYRALVRAKVACIRAHQPGVLAEERAQSDKRYLDHLSLAGDLASRDRPALIIMHGLSGSGKSTAAAELVALLGAIRCRSDVERKRLHGISAGARSGSALAAGIYSSAANRQTYDRLAGFARDVLDAGYPVIVDAAFLSRNERDCFRALAQDCGAPFAIASCSAPLPLLRERVMRREGQGRDASEAGLAVLERQLEVQEPLDSHESACVFSIDTSGPEALPRDAATSLASRLKLGSLYQV